jgi:type IV pilus assembly protein PilN
MIKINLLPTKKKPPKKVTELQQQLILGSLILLLTGGGLMSYANSLSSKRDALVKAKTEMQAKIAVQDNLLQEVKSVEDERKKVNDKIDIIEQLKKNQDRLVHLLDEISKALPQGVNLSSLGEDKGQINIEGTAFTNNDVVHFIDNLKASPYFADVSLQETVEGTQDGIEIYKYKLQFVFKGV